MNSDAAFLSSLNLRFCYSGFMDFDSPERKQFKLARQNMIKDRQADLEYAAKYGEEPGILRRLGQYPEDWALGIAQNKLGVAAWPTSAPEVRAIDDAYQKALQRAVQNRRVPSGWEGL